MNKLTPKKVKEYVEWRSNQKIKQYPEDIADACNESDYRFSHNKAIDILRLMCCNETIQ